MMKKLICLLAIISIALSLCVCGEHSAYAANDDNGKKEILFNDIPWESTYKETTSALKEKYNVDFAGVDDLVKDDDLLTAFDTIYLELLYNYKNDRVGFCVISTSPVKIAEEDAYIFLRFVFPNNGTDVLYDDYENAAFVTGTYLFSIEPHEKSYTANEKEFMERYSINKNMQLSYNEKYNLYEKLNTLIKNKYNDDEYGSGLEHLSEKRPSVYVTQYKGNNPFTFRLNIDGYKYNLCELDAVAIVYYTPNDIAKENKAIIQEQNEAARIAYEQKKTDEILATDSSGL